jgi:ribosomal protein S18 acetylase RimI-like enzyme
LEIHVFNLADEAAVIRIWERCGLTRAWNDPKKDIRRKRALQLELFLVGALNGEIIATVMAGYDGHSGWLSYLGVDPAYQKRGFGREIVAAAELRLRALGRPKINLQVQSANTAAMEIYQSIGFAPDEVLSFGKRLEKDEPAS